MADTRELKARRLEVWKEMKRLIRRSFTPEESQRWDELDLEMNELDEQIKTALRSWRLGDLAVQK